MFVLATLLLLQAVVAEPQDTESPFTRANIKNADFIKKKLDAGLSPEAKNDTRFNQDTLLIFAVRHDAPDTVEVVLKAGAKVDRRTTGFSKTALFQAAYMGHIDVARKLVEFKTDVNATDDDGNNALREAILAKRPKMIEYLLEVDCDPSQANKQGQTMIDLAEKHGTAEIKRLLKEKKREPK